MLASVTYGIIEGPNAGWSSPSIVGAFAASVLSLIGLLAYEPRRDEPLIAFTRSLAASAVLCFAIDPAAAQYT